MRRIVIFFQNKMIQDMLLNIIATSVPIAVLQLIVYPLVAKSLGSEEYGFMLTVYSIWIMIPNSLGAVLNNVRLLHNEKYEDKEKIGDFAYIHRRWTVLSAAFVFAVIWIYCGSFNARHLVFGALVAVLLLTRIYLEVGFRLEFNYKKILFCNLLQGCGFLIGGVLCYYTDLWELIYFLGYGFGCAYAVKGTMLSREKPFKTERYRFVLTDSYNLSISIIINSLIGYADKLVLFPLMGGTTVSIYYTATILGKITSLLATPINGVILNYIANWERDDRNIFGKALLLSSALAGVGYTFTLIIGRPVIGWLFPQWVDDVMVYIPYTTMAVMVGLVGSVLQPFVMKFCAMKWQSIINGIGAVVYFTSALSMWVLYGLKGFCIGTIAGACSKVILLIVVYYVYQTKSKVDIKG